MVLWSAHAEPEFFMSDEISDGLFLLRKKTEQSSPPGIFFCLVVDQQGHSGFHFIHIGGGSAPGHREFF